MKIADNDFLKELEKKVSEKISEIKDSKSEYPRTASKYYYVSSIHGSDDNDGLSEESPIATLAKLNSLDLQPGEVVLLERGSTFWDQILTRPCVTYSAYGTGPKPNIFGIGKTADSPSDFELTEYKNVWKVKRKFEHDIGNIIFDEGKACGVKRFSNYAEKNEKGETVYTRTDGVGKYTGLCDLNKNLEFHYDKEEKNVYLYFDKGNPADFFNSIIFAEHYSTNVYLRHGVTVDNLCVKYSGAHGISGANVYKITVRNCEIAWCGGSILSKTTRFGNAVEIYGTCDEYYVLNNYIHDIYDTGITHQSWDGKAVYMNDCRYEGNVIERCVWNIEYINLGEYSERNRMSHITIKNNILRFAGEGFGSLREQADLPRDCHINGWPLQNPADNFVIEDNILDRARRSLIDCGVKYAVHEPKMKGNTYIQYESEYLGFFGPYKKTGCRSEDEWLKFDENVDKTIMEVLGDKEEKVYMVK